MKVLIIGINYAPEIISTGLYTTGLAEFLAAEGHTVDVITAVPYYPAWKVMAGWPKFSYRRETSASGIRIIHAPLYVPRLPGGLKRILHTASFTLMAAPVAAWLALRRRPDIVVVVAPSLISALTGWMAARLARAKSWLHIQDFEVEAAFATGLLKSGTTLARAATRFERWMLARFDRISSISPPMVERLLTKGVPAEHAYEFRNWADLSAVAPLEDVSPLKAELGITTPYVALYSGNIANKQGIEIIPEMARHLGHRRDLLCMADVHLLPKLAGAAHLVLPSKLTNTLALGRPARFRAVERWDGASILGRLRSEMAHLVDVQATRSIHKEATKS